MSFFGFDTSLPRDRPNPAQQSSSRGMFEQHDPFGGLGGHGDDEGEILDFEETYDGLGQHLDESGDTFNDDTFGGDEPVTREDVGRDFDFAGQTAQMRGELLEEQALHQARQQTQPFLYGAQPAKPKRTGYEAYKEPEYIPKLEADASIWGTGIGKRAGVAEAQHNRGESAAGAAGRKMMSLEEVEAMMRAQSRATPTPPVLELDRQSQGLRDMLGVGGGGSPLPIQQQQHAPPQQQQQEPPRPMQILQRPQPPPQEPPMQQPIPSQNLRAPQILQRQPSPQHAPRPQSQDFHAPHQAPYPTPPSHAVQMPMGPPPVQHPHTRQPSQHQTTHNRGPSYNGPPITQAQQMMSMSADERTAYLEEEARRAKRNHKIFLLSKNNGLMTPQDKNFITRIQLQQLLTATGGVDNLPGSDDQLAEDFYYQVYAQIRGPPRSGPGQPLNMFAQTYLFQTGGRYGYGRSRHHPRGGDNHVQRMEHQVARAVEAAKARPKNKSLVVEGSLGKIAFSNSKTPRPLLNIKRPDSASMAENKTRRGGVSSAADRKAALRDIEALYTVLMRLEDHERHLPPPPNEESSPEVIEGHMRWRSEMQALNRELWERSKVMEPLPSNPSTPHPFTQLLNHSKGKKAIPRIFRHLDDQQRLTMLTLLVINLDSLDVIANAFPSSTGEPLPARIRDEIDLFNQAVIQPLFTYINEAPLTIIIGLLGLALDRTNIQQLVRTRIGASVLTMLISRAELAAQAHPSTQPTPSTSASAFTEDKAQWADLYTRLFDTIEPVLPVLFPPSERAGVVDDVYVWQFLAAMGVGASPDQQQRLVLGVKEKVMEAVEMSRGLPRELRERRERDVNLFMRAIGLDVELLS